MATMLPDGRRLGAHLAMGDGIVKAADRAGEIGATALQIFSDNPTAWERRAAASPEIPAFRERLATLAIDTLAIHASYLINLAGDDETFRAASIRLLAAELETACWFGARLVNIHIGSHRGTGLGAGVRRLVDGIGAALAAERAMSPVAPPADLPVITLENSAGGGGGLGIDVAELATIAESLDAAGIPRDRVAFCIDTAHLWGAGADLSDPIEVDRLIRSFDDTIGIDRLPLIHLNDTKAERGSRLDRHEHVGAGRIGPAGIRAILTHPLLEHTTYILETPGMEDGYDAVNLARAVAIARGERPGDLPPEAFQLRGSRSKAATPPADGASSRRRRRPIGTPAEAVADGAAPADRA
jgi:deoxyribonuclease IV